MSPTQALFGCFAVNWRSRTFTDRGSQYAANAYQKILKARGTICSMSRKGDCWDNAVAESFFATLKVEFVHESLFRTRAQATSEIFEYIEVFYNRELVPRAFRIFW